MSIQAVSGFNSNTMSLGNLLSNGKILNAQVPYRDGMNTYLAPQMPNNQRNYCLFDQNKVDSFVKQKEQALPYLSDILVHSNNEAQITETLYIVDRLIDNGVKGVDKMYPILSRFNQTNSPNIQTFLAGIYRKIQVPDAFGPLVAMLIRNSVNPPQSDFDPNEEVGGAILAYLSDRFRK